MVPGIVQGPGTPDSSSDAAGESGSDAAGESGSDAVGESGSDAVGESAIVTSTAESAGRGPVSGELASTGMLASAMSFALSSAVHPASKRRTTGAMAIHVLSLATECKQRPQQATVLA